MIADKQQEVDIPEVKVEDADAPAPTPPSTQIQPPQHPTMTQVRNL